MHTPYLLLIICLKFKFLGNIAVDNRDIDVQNCGVTVYDSVGIPNFDHQICIIPDTIFQPSFSFLELLDSLHFDYKFKSGRWTQLFGETTYKYGSVLHYPTPITENRYVSEMFDFLFKAFPRLCHNSCLINYYPDQRSSIPEHSDDETCIVDNSFILTISFGDSRRMFFKEIASGNKLCSILLKNCHILIFSKSSQYRFSHSIPLERKGHDYSPRISATFRNIN